MHRPPHGGIAPRLQLRACRHWPWLSEVIERRRVLGAVQAGGVTVAELWTATRNTPVQHTVVGGDVLVELREQREVVQDARAAETDVCLDDQE